MNSDTHQITLDPVKVAQAEASHLTPPVLCLFEGYKKLRDLENLLSFVRHHDITAWIKDGAIYGEAIYSRAPNQNAFIETESIGTTMQECRDWLGY
jgi:hypothetical protein